VLSGVISSGVDTGMVTVIGFAGEVGVIISSILSPDTFLADGPATADPKLAERLWPLLFCASMLALLAATTPVVVCPLPKACGRCEPCEGNAGATLLNVGKLFWLSFVGEIGRGTGDSVPGVLPASLGDVIREEEETVEPDLGGGN
jgi:hypothetical protein